MEPEKALETLRRAGLRHRGVLGAGMEGTVVDLGDGTVAKVWSGRRLADVAGLRTFLDAVHEGRPSNSSVDMPRILDLRDVEGTPVTIEQRHSGTPVWRADGSSPQLTTRHIAVMVEALAALAAIPGHASLRTLPIIVGEPPFAANAPFETELAGLVMRRGTRFSAPLRATLPEVDDLISNTVGSLHRLHPATPALIHGDLIAANVLVTDGRASAVLDFGFLTTSGDPLFDVAITASIFDMYGPDAAKVEHELDRAFSDAFGNDPHRRAIYRAAYALATACCYGTDLSEGHFSWCVNMLNRPEIREAL